MEKGVFLQKGEWLVRVQPWALICLCTAWFSQSERHLFIKRDLSSFKYDKMNKEVLSTAVKQKQKI